MFNVVLTLIKIPMKMIKHIIYQLLARLHAKNIMAFVGLCSLLAAASIHAQQQPSEGVSQKVRSEDDSAFVERTENVTPLSQQVEDLKQAALELNRDLLLLEEDLLFPANTQVAVYVSLDVGEYFALDAIKLTINNELVASHLYTQKQNNALIRGGIQRLYLGNLKTGKHEITAFFHGIGPQKREYKRGASYTLTKDQTPTMLEIKVRDSSRNMQPTFEFKEWHL